MSYIILKITIFNRLFNHGILLFSGYWASTVDDDTLNNLDVSQMSLDYALFSGVSSGFIMCCVFLSLPVIEPEKK